MDINWTELVKGAEEVLAKEANTALGPLPTDPHPPGTPGYGPAPKPVPAPVTAPSQLPSTEAGSAPAAPAGGFWTGAKDAVAGAAHSVGSGIYNHTVGPILDSVNSTASAVGQMLPLAVGGLMMMGGRSNNGGSGSGPRPPQPLRTAFIRPSGDVHPLGGDQLATQGMGKYAAGILDPVGWAATNRIANKVLDSAVGHKDEKSQKHSDKEVEITSNYPEIKHMLKDEDNKDHLRRLMSEKH